MNENVDDQSSGSPLERRNPPADNDDWRSDGGFNGSGPHFHSHGASRPGQIDLWTAIDVLLHRWPWTLLGMVSGAVIFCALGWHVVKPKYTASAQLLRREIPGKSEYFKTPPISAETFAGLVRSPEILRHVGDQLVPPVPPSTLNKWIKIDPEPDSDLVKILAAARTPEYAVNLVNIYASNVVEFLRDQDARQAAMLAEEYLKKQVAEMDQDITNLENQFRNMPLAGLDTNQLARVGGKVSQLSTNLSGGARPSMAGFNQQAQRLQTAMQELNDLLLKYTEIHPAVVAKEEYINELKQRMAAGTNTTSTEVPFLATTAKGEGANPDVDIIHIKLRALEDARVELGKRQREAALYAFNRPAGVQVFAPADLKTLKTNLRKVKIFAVTIFGGLFGLAFSIGLVLLVEFLDSRLKTAEDIARVTSLPVLTTLGNLREMRPEDRTQWAFRAWTMLQGHLSPSSNHGLICGITSAASGEGRSTWISLLAEAASLTGYRVLTIATRPSATHVEAAEDFTNDYETNSGSTQDHGHSNAVTTNILTTPAKITEQLTRPNSQPVVHIPLPGWVWNLERRKQWREALKEWNQTENLVILVELPPASVPEAVLLGSNLPNMVWLASSGAADAYETRAHLETLRHARCHLVGAVLNRAPGRSLKQRFPRWLGLLAFGLTAFSNTQAQQTSPPIQPPPLGAPAPPPASPVAPTVPEEETSPQTNRTFSIVQPSQRAAWQQRLTLGPGDVMTLNLYGQPELTRAEVAIGPDGRISYLEAQDVQASGLTIDELRARLNQEIGKYRRAPRTMVTPVAFRSKRYFVLGKVATKGVFTMESPLTVLEALARAHGFEAALVDRNVYDLVNFQRSFLARRGQRIPLDFEKLFQQGDLSQNIPVEPGDYIYFAPGDVNEVYVVGEVRLPGPVTYTSELTIIGAIAERGGYSERAYKARVLVVRGSLSSPQRIAVDTHAILDARRPDFKLQPRDIIFVNSRPFIKVEELADLAATAFIQSVVSEAVGVNVVSPIVQ